MESSGKILQVLILILCGGLLYYSYDTSKSVKALHEENAILWEKLDSIQAVASAKPAARTTSTAPAQTKAASLLDEIFGDLQKEYQDSKKESTKAAKTAKMTVSSSYRIEDRYVSYKVDLPEILGDQEGVAVIDISVDRLGNVTKTSVNAASTITDDNVLDAARKAALKTDFNYVSGAPESQKGTITYTFAKKK